MTSVNIQQAAKQLHRHPATIRKWIRLDGAPVVELGRSAKGHGSLLVDPQQLAAWYAARHLPALQAEHQRQELAQLALWFLDAMKRDSAAWASQPMKHSASNRTKRLPLPFSCASISACACRSIGPLTRNYQRQLGSCFSSRVQTLAIDTVLFVAMSRAL